MCVLRSAVAWAALTFMGAGHALAQSSVTLYGAADVGLGRVAPGTLASRNFADTDANDRPQFISGSLMNNTGSRFGLRGVEDLGGGVKVGFWWESLINMNNGEAGFGPSFWNREANLWVEGRWGRLTLGRDLTPTAWALIAYDLTTAANYSVVANTFFFPGKLPRASSMLAYKTPNMGGLTLSGSYILKDDNVGMAAGRSQWEANAVYVSGPLTAVAGASKVKDNPTNYVLGVKYRWSQFALGGTYMAAYPVNGPGRRAFSLGGSFFHGPFSATLDVARDTRNEWAGRRYTNGVVDVRYALSKRTMVYGAYMRFDDTNNYGIGIRHTF